jgi:hypothetical protein
VSSYRGREPRDAMQARKLIGNFRAHINFPFLVEVICISGSYKRTRRWARKLIVKF